MVSENDRQDYLEYWRQFGNNANINGMMLNANASIFEESDRHDVCLLLPDLKGKNALDAGAGIGRFTAELASKADKVSASDFIPEYVTKLQELSAEAFRDGKIIDVTVADATRLSYPENSFFLVFTNWLFMYFNNTECARFTVNALKWLEEGGYFKIRESCSEPSTGRVENKQETSLHATVESNPTVYRFSSVYLKLIETARYIDSNNQKWKFEIEVCGSVPTYIFHGNNWRQVQLIAKKVKANDDDVVLSQNELRDLMVKDWIVAQVKKDSIVDGVKKYFADKIFAKELSNIDMTNEESISAFFVFQSSFNSWYKRIYPFSLPSNKHCHIWTNEGDRELFRCSLTSANEEKNTGIFFTYTKDNVFNALKYVEKRNFTLKGFLAIDYLSNHEINFIQSFKKIAIENAKILLLESYSNEDEKNEKLSKINQQYTMKCVTEDIHNEIKNIHQDEEIIHDITSKKWMFININH